MLTPDDPRYYDPSFDDSGSPYDNREPDPDAEYERAVYQKLDEQSTGNGATQ